MESGQVGKASRFERENAQVRTLPLQPIPDSIIRITSPAVGEDGGSLPSRGAIQKENIMLVSMFKPTQESQDKYKKNYHGTTKIANVTMATTRWGNMFICENCDGSWNDHTGYSVNGCPIGMCLTDENLKAYRLEIIK